jgi:hypothetical protein
MLSFARDRGWEILDLSSSATVDATIREVSDCPIEDSFDGLNCGADYLSVIHLSFGCDPRIFELVDYLVSKTFDLPTCVVTVEYRQGRKAFFESVTEATDPAKQLLKAIRVTRRHDVIPRKVWRGLAAVSDRPISLPTFGKLSSNALHSCRSQAIFENNQRAS